MAGVSLNRPVKTLVARAGAKGYWLVASDGGVFDFSNRTFAGSLADAPPTSPIVAVAATP
jgi:hypothetical protein